METREIHERLLEVLKEVHSSGNIPEDSKFLIQGDLTRALKEIHKCVLEEISLDEITNQ